MRERAEDLAWLQGVLDGSASASVLDWGEGIDLRVEPELVFTWTRHPGR